MVNKFYFSAVLFVISALVFWPSRVSAQTTRGDFNYDGATSISDLTFLIDYLLTGQWNEEPIGLQRDTVTVNGVPFVMVHVDGGSYSPSEGVTVTVGDFSIGKTEVTQQLWKAVMGGNPNYPASTKLYPMKSVSWNECQEFIVKLNELTGLSFRLPRSVEWEFAARGGNHSGGYVYAGSNNADMVAHYGGISNEQNVAILTCNELGLYDMSGNVNEWCDDVGSNGSQSRVVRGGNYKNPAWQCLISWQSQFSAGSSSALTGLRLAM